MSAARPITTLCSILGKQLHSMCGAGVGRKGWSRAESFDSSLCHSLSCLSISVLGRSQNPFTFSHLRARSFLFSPPPPCQTKATFLPVSEPLTNMVVSVGFGELQCGKEMLNFLKAWLTPGGGVWRELEFTQSCSLSPWPLLFKFVFVSSN